MRDTRRWLSLMGAVAVVGGLWIRLSAAPAWATTGGEIPSPREGFAAPTFQLETLDGGELGPADLRGQVVVINFWASWCPPCRAEMAALQRTYEENESRGLEILAVNATHQDSMPAAEEFVRERGLSFPILLDSTGLAGNLYRTRALPTTFFVGRDGVIEKVIVGGPMSEATLQSTVQSLLAEGD